jgi:effector-binding domain-containing protein
MQFTEKALPNSRVAQIVATVYDPQAINSAIPPMFERLATTLEANRIAFDPEALAWFRPMSGWLEFAAAFPVADDQMPAALADAGIEWATLDGVDRAITVRHQGSREAIGETWAALLRYAEGQGCAPTGIAREVRVDAPVPSDPSTWTFELQQPVS